MINLVSLVSFGILVSNGGGLFHLRPIQLAFITLWITGFLIILNVVLAIVYRKRPKREVLSYAAACVVELVIFTVALLWRMEVITQVPLHLPAGVPINRADIGAALAVGLGLFPAAYWHRINVSELPQRLAADAKILKDRNGGVRVPPGEWMN
ncbi:hypothetical protein EPA93_26195 [Ktedonosporobacter rubrisoli]|uniref:Uncharacterized protein n=1 Tax=Ktedonosporobacter rubrisoli TaxID=2509675 RepID=A0A4P6JUG9_KTERU|nr:hypothetical protein [Ktedonosporobacter rubrisoli]QBD79288.1 hypothetical protein EPA93_26195 [Ktedonosporobacter rubrisoli]